MIDEPMPSEIPYSERELIQRAINNASLLAYQTFGSAAPPRWAIVKKAFGCGKTVSQAICTKYGYDPDHSPLG